MDLDFSEEQKILKTSARDFLVQECPLSMVREMAGDETGYPPELWDKMAAMGWLGLIIPEQYGGEGCSFLDLTVLMEEMGRACMPAPYATQIVSILTILEAASEAQKKELLPQMTSGKLITTLAISEDGLSYEPSAIKAKAVKSGEDYIISGTKIFVPVAHVAQRFIIVARTSGKDAGGLTLFIVDAQTTGISLKPIETVSGEKQFELTLDKVKVNPDGVLGEVGKAWTYLTPVIEKAAVAKCAEMVGAAENVLEMAVEYSKQREQYGQLIGKFQAIQHHCANMKVDVDSSRLLTHQAAWMLSQGLPCAKQVSMTKAWVSEAYGRVGILGHQIHGGIGLIVDHDLPLYTKRYLGQQAAFGNADFHYETVAREIGL